MTERAIHLLLRQSPGVAQQQLCRESEDGGGRKWAEALNQTSPVALHPNTMRRLVFLTPLFFVFFREMRCGHLPIDRRYFIFFIYFIFPLSRAEENPRGGGADLAVIHFIPLYRSGSMAFVMQVGGIVLIFLSDPLSDPTLQKWNSWNNGRRAGPLPFPRQEVFKF